MYMDVCVELLNPLYIKKLGIARRKEKRSHEVFHCAVWVETKVGFGPGLVKVLMFII